jgi:hypothetical protein
MANEVRVCSAQVAQPNTEETDRMPQVPHLVRGFRGDEPVKTVLLAACPMTAIDNARQLSPECWHRDLED